MTILTTSTTRLHGHSEAATAVVVDMDGTLVDVHNALPHLPNLDAFHQATRHCPPTPHVVQWCEQQADAGHTLVIVTARMYRHEQLTRAWLDEHLSHLDYIGPLMRGDRDHRPDDDVKRDILTIIREDHGLNVVAAIDDRPRVIRLWQSLGIDTTVVYRPDWEAAGESYAGLIDGKDRAP